MLYHNRNFLLTLVVFSIMNGSANSLSTILTFLIEKFGFDAIDSGILGASGVISGFISSFIFPILIQKYNWYLKSMKIMVCGAFIAQISIFFAL